MNGHRLRHPVEVFLDVYREAKPIAAINDVLRVPAGPGGEVIEIHPLVKGIVWGEPFYLDPHMAQHIERMEGCIVELPPWPKRLIVSGLDLMQQFEVDTGSSLDSRDYREIITQIIDLMLEFGRKASESYPLLPDMSRLVSFNQEDLRLYEPRLRAACQQLAYALQARLESLGAFRMLFHGDDLPYAFGGFHGHDFVLDLIPF